jgi:hypothetical protein
MSLTSGSRLVPRFGNAYSDTLFVLQSPRKATYYCSVQAIDNGFVASPFAEEQSFTFSASVQASLVTADSVQATGLKLAWKRGNGSACVVFACKADNGSAVPVDGTTYSADPRFGSGSQIGASGWYCVYNGTGNSVKVIGLEPLTRYVFHVIEYEAGPGYYPQTGQSNPLALQTNLFTEQTGISLPGISSCSVAWGDYDNDADLDILLTGYKGNNISISKIYRNDGNGIFTEQTNINLPAISSGSVAWGDYDNDGDLDILLTGHTGVTRISKIYRNDGNGTFIEQININLPAVSESMGRL